MTQGRCFQPRGFQLRFSETFFIREKEGIDLLHRANVSNYASEPVIPEIGLQTGMLSLNVRFWEDLPPSFWHSESERRRGICDNRIGNKGYFLVICNIDASSPKSAVPW